MIYHCIDLLIYHFITSLILSFSCKQYNLQLITLNYYGLYPSKDSHTMCTKLQVFKMWLMGDEGVFTMVAPFEYPLIITSQHAMKRPRLRLIRQVGIPHTQMCGGQPRPRISLIRCLCTHLCCVCIARGLIRLRTCVTSNFELEENLRLTSQLMNVRLRGNDSNTPIIGRRLKSRLK